MESKGVRWLIRSYISFHNNSLAVNLPPGKLQSVPNSKTSLQESSCMRRYDIRNKIKKYQTKLKDTKLKQDFFKVARMRRDGPL